MKIRRRACFGIAAVVMGLAGCWAQQQQQKKNSITATRFDSFSTKETNEALAELAKRVALPASIEEFKTNKGRDWNQTVQSLTAGTAGLLEQEDVQRFIDGTFKPVPVTKIGLKPVLIQPPNPLVPALTNTESPMLWDKARSVGRLIYRTCPGNTEACFSAEGTLFMVNQQIAATNCHVMQNFIKKVGGKWTIRPGEDLYADFGSERKINLGERFQVLSLAACSQVEGFDVALMKLAPNAVNGVLALPPPLSLEREPLTRNWDTLDARIYVIGFPRWTGSGQADLEILAASGDFSRLASPGVLSKPLPRAGYQFLPHNSSTAARNSGSPLIDMRTLRVVGIHNCCQTALATPAPMIADPPCATVYGNTTRNLALPSWYIANDPDLKPFLP